MNLTKKQRQRIIAALKANPREGDDVIIRKLSFKAESAAYKDDIWAKGEWR